MKIKIIFGLTALIVSMNLNFAIAQDTIHGKIKSIERIAVINAPADSVFAFMDDIRNTGKHMTESSGAMGGSKLQIQWLTDYKTGLGTKYRWRGKVAGMKIDFTVEVNKWMKGKEKVWGTVGDAKMIVIDWFEMYLITSLKESGKSEAKLGIYYTKHKGL